MTLPISMPLDAAERKRRPVVTGLLDYFPDALLAVAELSLVGNEQHNPGEPLHWARGKSTDQADTLVRHLMERGTLDTDGVRHSAKAAWRALALLQEEIEAEDKAMKAKEREEAEAAFGIAAESRGAEGEGVRGVPHGRSGRSTRRSLRLCKKFREPR